MSRLPEYLYRLSGTPTPEQEARSQCLMADRFYALPKEIECFIARANQELPNGWHVEPWTINRAVTLFRKGEIIKVIDYQPIEEGDVVKMLDLVNSLARQ